MPGQDHILLEVDLKGVGATPDKTVYYADTDVKLSVSGVGRMYPGRLNVSSFSRGLPDFFGTGQIYTSLDLSLSNLKDASGNNLDTDFDPANYFWHNREARILTGSGLDYAGYTMRFIGIVRFPEVLDHNSIEINFTIDDLREKDNKSIPLNVFNTTDYPNVRPSSVGKPVPNVYGSFKKADGVDGLLVRLQHIIDEDTDQEDEDWLQYKLNDGACKALNDLYVLEEVEGTKEWVKANEEFTMSGKSTANSTVKVGGMHRQADFTSVQSGFKATDIKQCGPKLCAVGWWNDAGTRRIRLMRWDGDSWTLGSANTPTTASVDPAPVMTYQKVGGTDRVWVAFQIGASGASYAEYTDDFGDTWGSSPTGSMSGVVKVIHPYEGDIYAGSGTLLYRVTTATHTLLGDIDTVCSPTVHGEIFTMEVFGEYSGATGESYLYFGCASGGTYSVLRYSKTGGFVCNSITPTWGVKRIMQRVSTPSGDMLWYNDGNSIMQHFPDGSDQSVFRVDSTSTLSNFAYIEETGKMYILYKYIEAATWEYNQLFEITGTDTKLLWQSVDTYKTDRRLFTSFNQRVVWVTNSGRYVWFSSMITDDDNPQRIQRKVAIEMDGRKDASSNLIEEPVGNAGGTVRGIIDDILLNLLSVPAGNIDLSGSFDTVRDILTNSGAGTFRCHRVIDSSKAAMDYIQELCRECGILFSVRFFSGVPKYYVDYYKPEAAAGVAATVYTDIKIRKGSFNAEKHGTKYFNRIICEWQNAHHTKDFQRVYEKDDTTAQTDDLITVEEALQFFWRYRTDDYVPLEDTGGGTPGLLFDLLTFLAAKPERITAEVYSDLAEELGSVAKITFAHLTAIPIQCMTVNKGLAFRKDLISGPDVSNLSTPP